MDENANNSTWLYDCAYLNFSFQEYFIFQELQIIVFFIYCCWGDFQNLFILSTSWDIMTQLLKTFSYYLFLWWSLTSCMILVARELFFKVNGSTNFLLISSWPSTLRVVSFNIPSSRLVCLSDQKIFHRGLESLFLLLNWLRNKILDPKCGFKNDLFRCPERLLSCLAASCDHSGASFLCVQYSSRSIINNRTILSL